MAEKMKWGIIGTGNIANQFATGLQAVDDAELVAVGSRSQGSADAFGEKYNIPNRHASYEALATDPEVDAIYISTPHPYHKDNTLLCIENGKAVLCEKPFTVNAAEAVEVVSTAREKGVFLMEAMWTRFLPVMVRVREMLAAGTLGEIRYAHADFGFWIEFDAEHRLFNPQLAGGALLDVGIYPVSFASMVFGTQPQAVVSTAHMGQTGVDEQNSMIFSYEGGASATLASAIRVDTTKGASICGDKGRIDIHPPFFVPTAFTFTPEGGEPETITPEFLGNGYNYQAMEVAACIRAGKLESDIMPLDESIALMQTMDGIRAEWGLKYPMEV